MAVDVFQAAEPGRAPAILPTGAGLTALPPGVWESWEMREAAPHGHPGAVIAAARKAHGLNQGQLGKVAGFSQSAISRLESGGNLAYDLRMLRIFQRLLGIPAHLLGLAPDAVAVSGREAQLLTGPLG